VHVLAAAAAAVAVAASPVGAYRFADGSVVALVPQSVGTQTGGVRYVDYSSGALRQLTRQAGGVLTGGPGVSVPEPVALRISLDGPRLRRDEQVAKRLPLATEDVSLRSGGVRLAGRLLRPAGQGPFPAVVLVPGSVRADRDTYDLWAYFFASRGFAVLSYDKRGVGASTGTYVRAATDANLRDQAADALAGVEWLRHRRDVRAARVGLSGGSQAGWTIALAASTSSAVRFAAIQSGAGMSVGRQLAYSALTHGGTVDVTDAQVDAALADVKDSGFDPRPALASLKIPVLWQLGELDRRMRTPETLANLHALTGHDFTVRVYEGGAHSLRVTAHGVAAEETTSPGFVAGVFRDLGAWLRAHVTGLR
jgi:dienelactone hydrolase